MARKLTQYVTVGMTTYGPEDEVPADVAALLDAELFDGPADEPAGDGKDDGKADEGTDGGTGTSRPRKVTAGNSTDGK